MGKKRGVIDLVKQVPLLLNASADTLVNAMHENMMETDMAIQGVPLLFVLKKIFGAFPSRAML
jgi:hypothetical protein